VSVGTEYVNDTRRENGRICGESKFVRQTSCFAHREGEITITRARGARNGVIKMWTATIIGTVSSCGHSHAIRHRSFVDGHVDRRESRLVRKQRSVSVFLPSSEVPDLVRPLKHPGNWTESRRSWNDSVNVDEDTVHRTVTG